MYKFIKGDDIVEYLEGNLHLHLSIYRNKIEDVNLIMIPSLNIHAYTKAKDKESILKKIHESLESFFQFWLKKEDETNFLKHMLSLGFSITEEKGEEKVKKSMRKPHHKYGRKYANLDQQLILR